MGLHISRRDTRMLRHTQPTLLLQQSTTMERLMEAHGRAITMPVAQAMLGRAMVLEVLGLLVTRAITSILQG